MDLKDAERAAAEVVREALEPLPVADSVITPEEEKLLDEDPVRQFEDLATRLDRLVGDSKLPGHKEFSFPVEDGSETELTVVLHVYQKGENNPRMIGAEWYMTDPSLNDGVRADLGDEFLSERHIDPSSPLEQQIAMVRLAQSIEVVEKLQTEE